jgi:hypothetical protein
VGSVSIAVVWGSGATSDRAASGAAGDSVAGSAAAAAADAAAAGTAAGAAVSATESVAAVVSPAASFVLLSAAAGSAVSVSMSVTTGSSFPSSAGAAAAGAAAAVALSFTGSPVGGFGPPGAFFGLDGASFHMVATARKHAFRSSVGCSFLYFGTSTDMYLLYALGGRFFFSGSCVARRQTARVAEYHMRSLTDSTR